MKFVRYKKLDAFRDDVLPVLLEDEVGNNLPISIISGTSANGAARDWLMATVTDDSGRILLVSFCTKPFNMLLYIPHGAADMPSPVSFFAGEVSRIKFNPPGVLARTELARHFAGAYTGGAYTGSTYTGGAYTGSTYTGGAAGTAGRPMVLMRLDRLLPYDRAPGTFRVLCEDDLSFVPFWEQAFNADCNLPAFSLDENKERIRTRIGRDIHYIWEDGLPVSQAVFGRETPNGAVINWVYTPPLYRGRGYATSVVGELSKSLFERGKKFCCLFADAGNPISRGIYSKLGYYDVCEFEDILF